MQRPSRRGGGREGANPPTAPGFLEMACQRLYLFENKNLKEFFFGIASFSDMLRKWL